MHRLDDEDFEDDLPIFSGRGEGIMEEAPATGSGAARRNEDIALDLMKFIAVNTGYGKALQSSAGFSGKPSVHSAEEQVTALLSLFERCRKVVNAGS